MPGRSFSSGGYRYGFNGIEMDNEIKGDYNSVNFEYRMHDTRLARFLSIDPLAAKYPWNSSYAFAENRVIDGKDLEGLEYVRSDEQKVDNVTVQVQIKTYHKPAGGPESTSTVYNNTTDGTGTVTGSTPAPSTPTAPNPVTTPTININQMDAGNILVWASNRGVPAPPGQFTNPPTYNTPVTEPGATTNINLTSQFNQSYAVASRVAGVVPTVPFTVASINAQMNWTAPRMMSNVAPGNTKRMLIITNGSAASVANATAVGVALTTANPQLQVAVLSVPTRRDTRFTVVFNPTQDVANRWGWSAPTSTVNVPFTTPMIPTAPIIPITGAVSRTPPPYPAE